MLYVVAFPRLARDLLARIEAIRTRHSDHANQIPAHLTFVFGTGEPVETVKARMTEAARHPAFSVEFSPAIHGADSDGHYAFLPATDTGDNLQALYNALNPHPSRPAKDFVAHITLANSPGRAGVQPALDEAATLPLPASATIDELVLLDQSEGHLTRISAVGLQR